MTAWGAQVWRLFFLLICSALMSACSPWTGPFDGYYDTGADQPLLGGDYAPKPGDMAGLCTLEHLGGKVTYAYDTLDNSADHDVFIDDVRLVNPVGMRLKRIEVATPPESGDEMPAGIMAGWPDPPDNPAFTDIRAQGRPRAVPRDGEDRADDWGKTSPICGFAITPQRDDQRRFLLVLRLQTDPVKKATMEAIEVSYHDETGRAYRAYLGYDLTLRDPDFTRCFYD